MIPPSGVLLLDAITSGIAAWLLVCASGHAGRGGLEASLAWWLALLAWITAAGVVLGEAGGFGPVGFLTLHGLTLVGLAGWRRRHRVADFAALRRTLEEARHFFRQRNAESVLGVGLLLALAALTELAAWAQPMTLDALTYHLPRIGQWLQDGRITLLATADERMNFVAAIPEVFTAWLIMGTTEGFRPAVLAQAIGGIMLFGATVGLARHAGLGRVAALLAGALLFGMANVVVQFTTAQTDLFTAGIFAAAFYLWLCAARGSRASVLGAVGVGLALGAKGTLFYLAPSALVWVAWLAWRHPLPWSQWRAALLAGALGTVLFAGPGFLRNGRAYGNVLGPRESVEKVHHAAGSAGNFARKLGGNLAASFAQNFEPNSQPHGLREPARRIAEALAARLPEHDQAFTLDGLSRKETLTRGVLHRTEPDADATSFGVLTFCFFMLGAVIALGRWRRAGSHPILWWVGGVGGFLLFYHTMQQWHPYGFRYFVLVAPWVAVVAAWGLEQLPRWLRWAGWSLALAAAVDVGCFVTTHTHQAGWRAIVQPERSRGYFVSENWRAWSRQLDPVGAPLQVALPEERPVAGFFRQSPARLVFLRRPPAAGVATAEDLVRHVPGWTIVPAARFLGHEGQVAARVWLFRGDEQSPFSVAAYRALRRGEIPAPVLYRHVVTSQAAEDLHELLIRTWEAAPVRLALHNPGSGTCAYRVTTPLRSNEGRLGGGERAMLPLDLPAGVVVQVSVVFRPVEGRASGSQRPSVDLVP